MPRHAYDASPVELTVDIFHDLRSIRHSLTRAGRKKAVPFLSVLITLTVEIFVTRILTCTFGMEYPANSVDPSPHGVQLRKANNVHDSEKNGIG